MIQLDLRPTDAVARQFGWIALAGFPLAGVFLTLWPVGKLPIEVLWVLAGAGLLCGVAAALNLPAVLRPVYAAMMLIGWPIGFVISTTLLSLIFYLMFAPVGLVLRLAGRDPLRRKLDRRARSYWLVRGRPRGPASYLRLY